MVNESNANVYEQIFAGVESSSELAQAIARAVRQLREAMEKEDNCAVTAAHVRNLKEIDPSALASAYALAEETCTYWPTPGQIRELAGWSEETRSRRGLQWVFQYLAMHGVEGRPRGGGLRFGEDETGRRVLLEPEAVTPAPEIPPEIEATLAALGSGSAKQGLRYVSQHPVAKGWETFHGDAASRTAERIEAQWIRCSLHTTRKSRKAPGSGETSTIPLHGGRNEL
jgi:hypothetical protein